MAQQLNLLDPSLRPKPELLSLSNSLMMYGAFVLLMLVFGGIQTYREFDERTELTSVTENSEKAQEELSKLSKLESERREDPKLVEEIKALGDLITQQKGVLEAFDNGKLGRTTGFYEYMYGFAHQTIEGVWLLGFEIGEGGQYVELRGRTTKEHLLPQYIANLAKEPAFQGRKFSALNMSRVLPTQGASVPKPKATQIIAAPDAMNGQKPDVDEQGKAVNNANTEKGMLAGQIREFANKNLGGAVSVMGNSSQLDNLPLPSRENKPKTITKPGVPGEIVVAEQPLPLVFDANSVLEFVVVGVSRISPAEAAAQAAKAAKEGAQ